MKLDRQKGHRELRQMLVRTCPYCGEPFSTRDPQRLKCQRQACMRKYKLERYHATKVQAEQRGLSAPALKTACEALEAQLTPENRSEWRAIIQRFGWPRTPGYRDVARLTREVVAVKLSAKGLL